jgi:hypothetical protein
VSLQPHHHLTERSPDHLSRRKGLGISPHHYCVESTSFTTICNSHTKIKQVRVAVYTPRTYILSFRVIEALSPIRHSRSSLVKVHLFNLFTYQTRSLSSGCIAFLSERRVFSTSLSSKFSISQYSLNFVVGTFRHVIHLFKMLRHQCSRILLRCTITFFQLRKLPLECRNLHPTTQFRHVTHLYFQDFRSKGLLGIASRIGVY